jgi:hypothetical protein
MLGPTMAPQLWPSRATDQQIVAQELGQCLAIEKIKCTKMPCPKKLHCRQRKTGAKCNVALHGLLNKCIVQSKAIIPLHCALQTNVGKACLTHG